MERIFQENPPLFDGISAFMAFCIVVIGAIVWKTGIQGCLYLLFFAFICLFALGVLTGIIPSVAP